MEIFVWMCVCLLSDCDSAQRSHHFCISECVFFLSLFVRGRLGIHQQCSLSLRSPYLSLSFVIHIPHFIFGVYHTPHLFIAIFVNSDVDVGYSFSSIIQHFSLVFYLILVNMLIRVVSFFVGRYLECLQIQNPEPADFLGFNS